MTDDRNKVVDLIEKLMRRAKDGANATEAEVEQAVLLARRLMAKHDIDMAEILAKEDRELGADDVVELEARNAVKLDRHERLLAKVVASVCGVRWYWKGKWVENKNGRYTKRHETFFYGIRTDVEAARLLYCELLIIVKALARGRVGRGDSPAIFSYCDGFAYGLNNKIKEEIQNEPPAQTNVKTLIVAKEALMDAHGEKIGLVTAKARRPNSGKMGSAEFQQGYSDGKDFSLDKPPTNGKVNQKSTERIAK